MIPDVSDLVSADVAGCTRDRLVGLVAAAERVQCWLDSVKVSLAQRADRAGCVGCV